MDKKLKLRNNREFRHVYDKGISKSNKHLVIFFIKNDLDYNRIGFSVTKKLGNAVTRNKVRRLIRESYRIYKDDIKTGYDIIFLSRVRCKDATYKEVESSILNLLKRTKLLK